MALRGGFRWRGWPGWLWLAVAASLAQALVAIALVCAFLAVLGLMRVAVEGAAERWITPVGHAMIAGFGLWLVWRGVKGLIRQVETPGAAADVAEGYDHRHHDDDLHHVHAPHCTHSHGPTLTEAEAVGGRRYAVAPVAGIALRPCSGALVVLIIAFRPGIALAGAVVALVMGLGTALITVAAALLAVWAREGALAGLGPGRFARAVPVIELVVGAVIAIAATGYLIGSL